MRDVRVRMWAKNRDGSHRVYFRAVLSNTVAYGCWAIQLWLIRTEMHDFKDSVWRAWSRLLSRAMAPWVSPHSSWGGSCPGETAATGLLLPLWDAQRPRASPALRRRVRGPREPHLRGGHGSPREELVLRAEQLRQSPGGGLAVLTPLLQPRGGVRPWEPLRTPEPREAGQWRPQPCGPSEPAVPRAVSDPEVGAH